MIFANLIPAIPQPAGLSHAKKVLVLAHREELLDQAASKIALANPKLIVDIDQGERHASSEADVIVGSVQSLGRADSKRLDKYTPAHFKAIIVDEVCPLVAP